MDEVSLEIFEKYKLELEIDTQVDELNVKDIQMKLPAIKHKWVARLIQAKADLRKLTNMRIKAMEQLKSRVNSPITLPETNIANAASKQELVRRIDIQITQQELIIDYLSRVEQIMKSFTYDIKNIIDIMRMESM